VSASKVESKAKEPEQTNGKRKCTLVTRREPQYERDEHAF
jgi:hypothetical protein